MVNGWKKDKMADVEFDNSLMKMRKMKVRVQKGK